MERLWQLGGLHHDPRTEVQEKHARLRQRALYPKPDVSVELQPAIFHEFRHLSAREDADAEGAVCAKI